MRNLEIDTPRDVFSAKWLRDVSQATIAKLRDISDIIAVRNRGIVYRIGDEQRWIWGGQEGQVRVHVSLNQMEPVLGHIHQTGSWFGESEPLLQVPGLVEMQASGDTLVTRINFADFRVLANRSPELWEALARLTSMNQVLAMAAANDLALKTGRIRLAAVLLRLTGHRADQQSWSPAPAIAASQIEIAALANISLSKASEELAAFAGAKLIQREYGRIVVLASDRLQSIINN